MAEKKLIIAEKSELANAIADAIDGQSQVKNGCIFKGDYIIVSCKGHLLSIKEPEDYDADKYGNRNDLSILPIFFPDWGLKVNDQKKETQEATELNSKIVRQKLAIIEQLLPKVSEVIHAGDADDEGQLIVDEVLYWFNYNGPVRRLQTNNLDRCAMRDALNNTKVNGPKEHAIGMSAHARRVADMIVGVNASRYFSAKNEMLLPVGRVQTPTLGLVVERDMQIEGHQKVFFYDVGADIALQYQGNPIISSSLIWSKDDPKLDDNGRITDKSYAESKAKSLNGMTLSDISIDKNDAFSHAPLPFNSTKLDVYCFQKFGITPEQTMKATQSLRLTHKAITYNRSECQYLQDAEFDQAPLLCKQIFSNLQLNSGSELLSFDVKPKCFNSSKIPETIAHTAIVPTNNKVDIAKMNNTERKVYEAICSYYLIQFMPPVKKEETKLSVMLQDGEMLRSTSSKVLEYGYKGFFMDLDDDSPQESSLLSSIPSGIYKGNVVGTKILDKETKPPSRYNIATLKVEMSRIARHVTDPKAKQILLEKDKDKETENGAIGTSATRTAIVNSLILRNLISVDAKGKLKSTEKGRELYRVLPDLLKYADTTAFWWAIQEDICEGKKQPEDLYEHVLQTIQDMLNTEYPLVDKSKISAAQQKKEIGECPVSGCKGHIFEGKKVYFCSEWKDSNDKKGCEFRIHKQSKYPPLIDKNITPSLVKAMLSPSGASISNIKSSKNPEKTYSTCIKVSADENGRAVFTHEEVNIGKCPVFGCGGHLIEGGKVFFCSNWKETENSQGCKFSIFKESKFPPLIGKKITASRVKAMLSSNGALISDIKSTKKPDTTYNAYIKVTADENGRASFKIAKFAKSKAKK